MQYPYPKEFPEPSRCRVRTEEILAGRAFEKEKQEADYYSDVEDLLRTYILRVFLAFVKEGSALVRRGTWSIVRLESESLEFLRRLTISAESERGGGRVQEMVSNLNGAVLERVERAFRKSPLWQEYEDILLATATARATGTVGEASGSISEPAVPMAWNEIEITFISDERVRVRIGPQPLHTCNYAEMGFEDRRSGKPNQAWDLHRGLAQANGVVPNVARDSKEFVGMVKRFERMRGTLKSYFHIDVDPVPLDPTRGYCCQFKIGCAAAFET